MNPNQNYTYPTGDYQQNYSNTPPSKFQNQFELANPIKIFCCYFY